MSKLKDLINKIQFRWTSFSKSQRFNLIVIIALLLVLPTTVGGVLTVQSLKSKAAPDPVTPPNNKLITVVSPNGGEFMSPNQLFTIKWTSSGIDQVAIDLIDSDGKFSTIALPMSASIGEFNWTTPPSWYGSSNQFKIKVYEYPSTSVFDLSDDYFRISYNSSTPRPTATPIATYPNLIIESVDLIKVFPPTLPCVGYILNVVVKNIGNAPAQTSRLVVTLNPGQTQALGSKCESSTIYSQSDSPIPQNTNQAYLNPGQSETYTNYFNSSTYDEVTISAFADYYKQIVESNEDDNFKSHIFVVEKVFPPATSTPNSTPQITATPQSSIKPTATPQVTSTPTASATPIVNSTPIITTTLIPNGKVGNKYVATISGYDLNKNDILSLNSSGFPAGIDNISCDTSIENDRKTISCIYSGFPKRPGIYRIKTTINDQKGGVASKTFYMYISFNFSFF